MDIVFYHVIRLTAKPGAVEAKASAAVATSETAEQCGTAMRCNRDM